PLGPLKIAGALALAALFSFLLVSIGLGIGARMNSMEGFGLVMNFLTWPMFFFGGALFDLTQSGPALRLAAYGDPFTYCVDLMRWVLLGWSVLPVGLDLAAVLSFCAATGAWGIVSFGGLQQTR
ncbi:MAG: ABC transporter permease, partial [Elusimicrobia bacterium]|nr:ABC transporter permease [Elusimicrobiota bacterium]